MSSALSNDSRPLRLVDVSSVFAYRPLIVLAGLPGAGKGTQRSRLVEQLGLAHISIGDALRQEVERGTPLGSRVRASLDEGRLVPDSDVPRGHRRATCSPSSGLRDSAGRFPRTVRQAQMLERLRPSALALVVVLVVPLATVLERLSSPSSG
jgi:adenylate kinase